MKNDFQSYALTKFSGCDNGVIEAGTPDNPSIWLLGIEHGTFNSIHDGSKEHNQEDDYSIEHQLTYPYNRKAFKLLAALYPEYGLDKHEDFAKFHKPFVHGQKGYFKGNLYPYPCPKESSWSKKAATETGFRTKKEYIDWCYENRLPVMHSWVKEHEPELIIGVGIGQRWAFAKTVFDNDSVLKEHKIMSDHKQRLFWHMDDDRLLVVIPHFSGPYGLNSNDIIRKTAEFIAHKFDTFRYAQVSRLSRKVWDEHGI